MKKLKWNLETLTNVSVLQTGIKQHTGKIIECCNLIIVSGAKDEDNLIEPQEYECLVHNMEVLVKHLSLLCGFKIQLKDGEVFHEFDHYICSLDLTAKWLNDSFNNFMGAQFDNPSEFRDIISHIRNRAAGIERLISAFTVEMKSWEVV